MKVIYIASSTDINKKYVLCMVFYIAGQNDYLPHVEFVQMFLSLVLVDPGSVASNRNLGTSISARDLEGSFAQ